MRLRTQNAPGLQEMGVPDLKSEVAGGAGFVVMSWTSSVSPNHGCKEWGAASFSRVDEQAPRSVHQDGAIVLPVGAI